jgi:hypothetical protein
MNISPVSGFTYVICTSICRLLDPSSPDSRNTTIKPFSVLDECIYVLLALDVPDVPEFLFFSGLPWGFNLA